MAETTQSNREKVVIQTGTKSIHGYLESFKWNSIEEVLSTTRLGSLETLRVHDPESDCVEDISISNVKAIFYVNSFEGNSARNDINFHTRAPIVHGIWVRLEFLDGEVMEGIVHNSLLYLTEPGFFVLPTDPGSNNRLVYVFKNWLVDHRVLGLRNI